MIFIPSLCAAKLSSFIIGWGPVTSLHRFIIIYPRFYCKVDMKCMVSYIQWYHEMNNGKKHRKKIYSMNETRWIYRNVSGSVRLLRTGASAGTPYRYNVYRVFIQLFSAKHSQIVWQLWAHTKCCPRIIQDQQTTPITEKIKNFLGLRSEVLVQMCTVLCTLEMKAKASQGFIILTEILALIYSYPQVLCLW